MTDRPNLPNLPGSFKLPGSSLKPGWQVWRFDQIAINVAERVEPDDVDTEYYVGLEHLDSDSLKIRRWGKPSEVEATKLRFCKGDIIFGRRRAYQRKLGVAEFDGICSAHAMVLRPRTEVVLPEFLPFFMQSDLFMNRALEISVGSLSPTINWRTLAEQEFALPPLEEQRRLAEVLWASLDVVEKNKLAVNTANTCLEAIREHLFAEHRTNRITLGRVLKTIEAGKSLLGGNKPPSMNEYAVLKVSAVGANSFRPEESKTLVDQKTFLPEYSVKSGDLLVTRANTPDLVGMTCYVEQDYPNLMLCDKTLRLVPKDNIAPKLLWEALWTRGIRQQIKSVATGTGAAMKNISQAKLKSIEIQLPSGTSPNSPILLQMSSMREALTSLYKRLQEAQSLHSTFINELLTGSE
jgi:type I restriction enzyme, S subunit